MRQEDFMAECPAKGCTKAGREDGREEKGIRPQSKAGKRQDFETCVCCHKKLKLLRVEPVDYRAYYIEGAGQLCYDCYHKIYG